MNRRRQTSWRRVGIAIVLTLGLVVGFFSSKVPITNDLQWTCAKTGSTKGKRVYLGLIHTAELHRSSRLERLLIESGQTHIDHEWVKTKGTERYLIFKAHRHSKAPASSDIDLVLTNFLERATDEQKRRLMSVFLSGPEDARAAAYRDAVRIAFESANPNGAPDSSPSDLGGR